MYSNTETDKISTSPKDYFINRLIVEAQRKLRYSNISIRELAYELGFNDPDYFTGKFFNEENNPETGEIPW